MPLYEYRKNAENLVQLDQNDRDKLISGLDKVAEFLIKEMEGLSVIACDGWYGVDWSSVTSALTIAAEKVNRKVRLISASSLFKSCSEVSTYRKKFVGDDPSFGWVNKEGSFSDVIDQTKVDELYSDLTDNVLGTSITIIYGPFSASPKLIPCIDKVIYFDFTMQPMLWQMWEGKLVPFEKTSADPEYNWKQYYYCDFYLLLEQKKRTFKEMDYFVEAVDTRNCKLLPTEVYNRVIDKLVSQPIKQVKITQPGPWGSYRFKDIYEEIPGLDNMAWNELAGIELSIIADLACGTINIPCQNVMQRPVEMVGNRIHQDFPDLLPLQVWLDDGYFAEPVPYERGSMPIHNHPDTDYNKRNFNEPLGRYETYYIVEAYRDAGTMMGFREDADLEEYERLCRSSNNQQEFDWEKYVRRWATNVGDLFLIPPGTEHGHGGNQMILEMDTGPSVAGTEYSFFTYDFARPTWDDTKKSMTGPRMKMHLEHAVRNRKWRGEKYVAEHLRARPVVVGGDGDTRHDQFTSIKEMPFEIERFVLNKPMKYSTEGKFLQIPTLTVGKNCVIRSIEDPSRSTSLEFLQACLIPAGFGDYEFVNPDGDQITIVMIRLKRHFVSDEQS